MVEKEEKIEDLKKKFALAVNYVQNLPKDSPYQSSNQEKLEFYGLFKQSINGSCNTKQPSRLNPIARMKWEAWNKLGKISKEEAMKKYILKTIEISKKIPSKKSEEIQKILKNNSSKL
jgi:diazepam-binding inhibitor (GABA receptor modulating acyl-CoA-binding protein)